MKKVILIALFFVFFSPLAKSQEKAKQTETATYANNIGGFAGFSGGLGLSYRYFKNTWGIQVACAPVFSSESAFFSLGLTGMYSLNRSKITQLYAYLGNHYVYDMYKYSNYDYITGTYSEEITDVSVTNITGAGLGFEIVAGKRVGFNFQFGYAYYHHSSSDWSTNFDGGVGIYYKW